MTIPLAVCIRNVEWPMKVIAAAASPPATRLPGVTSMRFGDAAPRSSSIRGSFEKDWPASTPSPLLKCRPSKWSERGNGLLLDGIRHGLVLHFRDFFVRSEALAEILDVHQLADLDQALVGR